MIEVLEFVFQSFWTWVGTLVLIWTIAVGVTAMVRSFFDRSK